MQAFAILILVFAAVCLWQLLAGLAKLRAAWADPGDPRAALRAKTGRVQAGLGGAMLAANVLFNLPLLRSLL